MPTTLKYDLLFCPDAVHHANGTTHEFMRVESVSERGDSFLLAYFEAIDKKCGGITEEEDGQIVRIQELYIPVGEFDAFKRQAELARVTLTEESDADDP